MGANILASSDFSLSLLTSKTATPKLWTNIRLVVDFSCGPDRNRLKRVLCYAFETVLDVNTAHRNIKSTCNLFHAAEFFLN